MMVQKYQQPANANGYGSMSDREPKMGLNFVRYRGRTASASPARALTALLMALSAVFLTACSQFSGDSEPFGAVAGGVQTAYERTSAKADVGRRGNFGGVVLADEPRASLVGRDILERGGSAADAAVATYFALSVTYPVAASLGGGGVCLAFSQKQGTVEALDFTARAAAAGGPVAVPGNVRGMALLHARQGRLRWGELLAPAENLAATGIQISRALGARLASAGYRDSALAARLSGPDGQPLAEGGWLKQFPLAVALGQIRSRGASSLYGSSGARQFAEAVQKAGGAVTAEDMRQYRPTVAEAAVTEFGDQRLHLVSADTRAGAFAAALWQALAAEPAAGLTAERVRTIAHTVAASQSGAGDGQTDYGSTSFVAVDGQANAVACAVTMNRPFGAGRLAADTGILLASPPNGGPATGGPVGGPVGGLVGGDAFLAPVLIVNPHTKDLYYAAAGAGGPEGAGAALQLARRVGNEGQTLAGALAASASGAVSPVNVFACAEGLSPDGGRCALGVEPHGFGLGLEALSR